MSFILNMSLLKDMFNSIQELVSQNKILALHDVSDGGFLVALAEMSISGNIGVKIKNN